MALSNGAPGPRLRHGLEPVERRHTADASSGRSLRPNRIPSLIILLPNVGPMGRSASFSTGRLFLVLMVALLGNHLRNSTHDPPGSLALTVLIGVGAFVVLIGILMPLTVWFMTKSMSGIYAAVATPGPTRHVDYYADRMSVASAGGVVRTTSYDSIQRVRVKRHMVVQDRRWAAQSFPLKSCPQPPCKQSTPQSRAARPHRFGEVDQTAQIISSG